MNEEEMLNQLSESSQQAELQDPGVVGQAYTNIQSQESNLIVWQLELDNILERIEHLLKGDVLTDEGNGNHTYKAPEDDRLVILNEYGVQLVMNFISFYLNRNTILSNYTEERIYEILHTLGYELSDLLYINYETMGLDTVEKKSRATMFVMNILHMIESAYNRALNGDERESLRKARIVTQNQPLNSPQAGPSGNSGFTLNPFKRLTGG